MPVSATKAANERREQPNLMSRRARTRKEGKCQLCEKKVPIKEQFTVTNDLDAGEAVKRKNAGAKGKETASHYCGDCATKRVKQKEAWIAIREGGGSSKPKKGKGKAAKKGKGKAKPKKAAKPKVKKVKKVGKRAGKKSDEPF